MRLLDRLRGLWAEKRGNALVIGAAALPLLIGSAAIGIDTVHVVVAKRQLQRAADSAAIAGAYARLQSMSVTTAALRDLNFNSDITLSGAPTIENSPSVGPFASDANAVRVVLAAERDVPFISFFTGAGIDVTVEATATPVLAGQYCVVSLEPGASTGISFTGNATVNMGCGMITNSNGASAITADGSATVTASPMAAVGTIPASSRYSSGTRIVSNSLAQADPYGALPTPTVPANCQNSSYDVSPNGTPPTLVPTSAGIYCYRGMDIKGTVTLPSGTYIVNGGMLSFGAQANVTCLGCTFILTSSNAVSNPASVADLDFNGGARVNITAPSNGTYAGVLIYQDRRAAFGTTLINGGGNMALQGGLYFPARSLEFRGSAGMNTQCLQMVALRLDFRGDNSITNNCPANGGYSAFDIWTVRLVG
jgi:Flp pilus assembly protein TadG